MWCYPICSHKTDRKQILVENPYKSIQVCLCSLGDSLHVDRDGEGRGAHERSPMTSFSQHNSPALLSSEDPGHQHNPSVQWRPRASAQGDPTQSYIPTLGWPLFYSVRLSIHLTSVLDFSQGCKLIRDEKGDNDANPLGGSGACSPGNIFYI